MLIQYQEKLRRQIVGKQTILNFEIVQNPGNAVVLSWEPPFILTGIVIIHILFFQAIFRRLLNSDCYCYQITHNHSQGVRTYGNPGYVNAYNPPCFFRISFIPEFPAEVIKC